MIPINLALGSVLAGGAFLVYPWGTESSWRVGIAIVLWVAGGVAFIIAVAIQLRRGESNVAPLRPHERRELFLRALTAARDEGNAIANPMTRQELERNVPPWQTDTQNLLRGEFQDPAPAQFFANLGDPTRNQGPNFAMGVQVTEQVQYLTQLIRDFAAFEVNEGWSP